MRSTRSVTALQAFQGVVLIVVLVGLFVIAVAKGMPAHLIIIVCLGLSRFFRAADEDGEPEPDRPPMRSFRLAPLWPPEPDRDHPMFDRDLDG